MKRTLRKDTSPQALDTTKPILNLAEAASLLGYSKRTVSNKARAGLLPGFKDGQWRFRRDLLLESVGSAKQQLQ